MAQLTTEKLTAKVLELIEQIEPGMKEPITREQIVILTVCLCQLWTGQPDFDED